MHKNALFFHPDYTVGPGISPDQPQSGSQALTAGEELRLAPKITTLLYDRSTVLSIANTKKSEK